jgi:hypothetical protein
MFSVIRALIARFKAMFVIQAVLELEAELAASCAERRAELFRLADDYDQQGLRITAQDLRQQAESLSAQQPLASVLAAVAHLDADKAQSHANTRVLPDAVASSAGRSGPVSKKERHVVTDVTPGAGARTPPLSGSRAPARKMIFLSDTARDPAGGRSRPPLDRGPRHIE